MEIDGCWLGCAIVGYLIAVLVWVEDMVKNIIREGFVLPDSSALAITISTLLAVFFMSLAFKEKEK